MSEWTYNNKTFDSDMIEDYIGFVYEVYDTEAKMKYIGKKKFWSRVTRPPLKGKKNNGKVKTKLGVEKSCSTWTYPEDRENFKVTIEGKISSKEIEHAKNQSRRSPRYR